MFDIGWSEMAVIAVVALIVIGPKDLPKLLFTAGRMAAKARATLHEFQQGIAEMGREAELEELRSKIEAARDFDAERELNRTLDPDGAVRTAFDPPSGAMPGAATPAIPDASAPGQLSAPGTHALDPEALSDLSEVTQPPMPEPAKHAGAPDQNRFSS